MNATPAIGIYKLFAVLLLTLCFAVNVHSHDRHIATGYQIAKTLLAQNSQSHFDQGESFHKKRQYEKAIVQYTKAIKLNPENPKYYIYRAGAHYMKGQLDNAISDCTLAISLNPSFHLRHRAHYVRGFAYSKKGETQKAIDDFTNAAETNSKIPDAHFQIATIEEKRGRIKEAVRAYENFIKAAPSDDKNLSQKRMIAQKKINGLSGGSEAKAGPKPKALQMQEEWAKYQDVSDVLKIDILKTNKTRKSQTLLQSGLIRQGQLIWNIEKRSPKPGTLFILMKISLCNTGNDQRKFNSEHINFRIPQGDPLKKAQLTSVKTKDGTVRAYSFAHKARGILNPKESRPLEFLFTVPENYSGSIDIYYQDNMFTTAKAKSKIIQSKKKSVVKEKSVARNPNQQLLDAAEKGQIQKLKEAIAQGADINFKTIYKETPLILASWKGHTACVETLLNNGAKVNLRNSNGTPALGPATQAGHLKIIELLLAAGAPVNSRINNHAGTALMLAAIHGHTDATVLLVKKGANVEAKNNDGTTPCMFASMNGRLNVLKILHDNGANINASDIHGATPLMFSAVKGYSDIAQYLIANGADVNAKLNSGSTALILATTNGHEKVVEILLKSGADVSVTDKMGQNAHSIAKQKKYHQILKLLERK